MNYQHLGNDDYLVQISRNLVESFVRLMAVNSYQTAPLKRAIIGDSVLTVEDHLTYSTKDNKVIGLNMGIVNQRQCYTRLQQMVGSSDFIFRGKTFRKSGRDPEQFLETLVKEMEKIK